MRKSGFREFLATVRKAMAPFNSWLKKIWYRFQLTRVLIAAILAVVLLVSGILTYQAKNGRCREFKSGIGTANGGLR